MTCPNCGEENSSAFRFCGMCGTPLESQPPTPSPVADAQAPARLVETRRSEPRHAPILNNAPAQPAKPQPPKSVTAIAGPSLLGLGQDSGTQPDVETLRQKSFSGVDSFLEPEEQASSGRRVFLLLVLLVALGAAGWWTYSNYQGATRAAHPPTSNSPGAKATPETPAVKPETAATPTAPPAANSSQPEATPAAPRQEVASSQPKPSSPPPAAPSISQQNPPTAPPKPVMQVNAARPKLAPTETPAAAAKSAAVVPDSGDADYRKGEAYLYGRGVAENCDDAVKFLKAASARQNAKARSTFGTMYATGHCVPRDLPTSYAWFALALHLDPNNQILEKDLTAIWNQMTPPERETATKSKQ